MDDTIIANLKENFYGKVCTILTQPVSFPFKDGIEHSQFFTGKMVEINSYGVWLKHLHIDTYAFYTFPIVGIIEEQVISEDDPRAKKIKEELEQKKEKKPEYVHAPSTFIPVDALSKLVRK